MKLSNVSEIAQATAKYDILMLTFHIYHDEFIREYT